MEYIGIVVFVGIIVFANFICNRYSINRKVFKKRLPLKEDEFYKLYLKIKHKSWRQRWKKPHRHRI